LTENGNFELKRSRVELEQMEENEKGLGRTSLSSDSSRCSKRSRQSLDSKMAISAGYLIDGLMSGGWRQKKAIWALCYKHLPSFFLTFLTLLSLPLQRRGDYLGKTVQIVPHLTTAIQDWIEKVARLPVDETASEPDVCIIELGGTVGDIESAPFVEAMRQFQFRVGHENFALIHVSLVPVIGGEQKTKPTQAAIRDLRGLGLVPDMVRPRED